MSVRVGGFVRLRTDPTRAGILHEGERYRAGGRMLPIQFPDGTMAWLPESALETVPQAPVSLAQSFEDGSFADGSGRGFAAIASMQSLRPPRRWDSISDVPRVHMASRKPPLLVYSATCVRTALFGKA